MTRIPGDLDRPDKFVFGLTARQLGLVAPVFAVLAGMVAYTLLALGVPHGVSEALAVVAAVVAGALVGLVAIGRRATAPLASLIITLGLGIGSYALLILVWGDQPISESAARKSRCPDRGL